MTIKQIPEAVLRQFKAACALEGVSMNEKLIDYMRREGDRVVKK